MLPSSNCYNPFDHYIFKRQSNTSHYDQNPKPKQDDPSLSASFPSPIFDENELPLNQILSHHQPSSENPNMYDLSLVEPQIMSKQQGPPKGVNNVLMSDDHRKEANNSKPNNKEINARVRKNIGAVPRRRSGKKDRHSKICTAQGIRDRRMRLSLQVARKFFDLQDLLGYEKASKTIEWLFNKSKNAISELVKDSPPQAEPHDMCFSNNDAKSESLISECEVVSGIDEHSNSDVKDVDPVELVSVHDFFSATREETKIVQKNAREEARARARCRTREKIRIKGLDEYSITRLKSNPNEKGFDFSNPNEFSLSTAELVSSSNTTFFSAAADHRETTNNHIQERRGFPQLCVVCQSFEPDKFNDTDTIEKLLGYTTSSSSSSCPIATDYQCFSAVSGFSDLNAAFMGFRGNYWDTFNNEKMNTIQYEDTSQVSLLAGNPNSVN